MSDSMFMGRKFSIPYDMTTDKQIASIARAQITTGTAAPGAVIQVGDQIMAYGVTPQQAKMGDLDVKLRSVHQLSNEAQEVVRRNIQWQYGEQVGDPMAKGWFSDLLGITHLLDPSKPRYGTPAQVRPLTPPDYTPPKPAAAPSAKRKAPGAPPAAKPAGTKRTTARAALATATAAAPAAAPAAAAPAAAAPAAAPAKKVAAPGPAPTAAAAPIKYSFNRDFPPHVAAQFNTAAATLAGRHEDARGDGWTVTSHRPDAMTMVSVATHKATQLEERHELSYDPTAKAFRHSYTPAGKKDAIHTDLSDHDALHNHVLGHHDSWAF